MRIQANQPLKLWSVVILVIISSRCCLASKPTEEKAKYCARFEFPDLPNHRKNLTVPEGSVITFSVRMVFDTHTTPPPHTIPSNNDDDDDYTKCLKRDPIVLAISKENSTHQDDCFIRVTAKHGCESFSKNRCNCSGRYGGGVTAGKGPGGGAGGRTSLMKLTIRAEKGDEGWLRWWTRDNVAPPVMMFLGVSDKVPENVQTSTNQRNDNNNDNDDDGVTHPSSRINLDATDNNNNDNNNNTVDSKSSKNNEDDDDNNDMKTGAVLASDMNVSSVGVIVAGINVATIVVIGLVILVIRRVCRRQGRLGRRGVPPPPCGLNAVMSERRRQIMSGEYSSTSEKRISTSSWVYDEIPADTAMTLITTDTSLYLHPVDSTTSTTTPATTNTTASTTTSTTITFTK